MCGVNYIPPFTKLDVFKYCLTFRLREMGMPADYVHKLARMFQDIKISEDLNQQFKEEYRKTKGSIAGNKIEVVITICVYAKEYSFVY